MLLSKFDIPDHILAGLAAAGIVEVQQLLVLSRDEVRHIPHVGGCGLGWLHRALLAEGVTGAYREGWLPPKPIVRLRDFESSYRGPQRASAGVCFVRCREFIKIGATGSLKERLIGLRTACPYKITLWHFEPFSTWQESYAKEKALHGQFLSARHRNEWFNITPEIVGYCRRGRRDVVSRMAA